MKKYGVTITYKEYKYVEVEAEDEDAAIELAAAEEYIGDDDCDYEVEEL